MHLTSLLGGLRNCQPCFGTITSPSLMLLMIPSSADISFEIYHNSPLYHRNTFLDISKTSTCVDDKSVLSVHMLIDSTIVPIDIPQDIVLSHVVRIHHCCWSLTADSHCLDWTGHVIQNKIQSQICQGGQCQNNHGTKNDNDRSKNWFPQTC